MHRQTEEGQMISSITVKISKSDSFPKCHCSYQGQAIMPMTMWSYEGIRGTGNLLCALIFDSKAEAKFLHECLRMCRTFSSSSFLICQAEGNVGRPSLFFGVRLTHHQDWNETWVSEYLCIWLRSPFTETYWNYQTIMKQVILTKLCNTDADLKAPDCLSWRQVCTQDIFTWYIPGRHEPTLPGLKPDQKLYCFD